MRTRSAGGRLPAWLAHAVASVTSANAAVPLRPAALHGRVMMTPPMQVDLIARPVCATAEDRHGKRKTF